MLCNSIQRWCCFERICFLMLIAHERMLHLIFRLYISLWHKYFCLFFCSSLQKERTKTNWTTLSILTGWYLSQLYESLFKPLKVLNISFYRALRLFFLFYFVQKSTSAPCKWGWRGNETAEVAGWISLHGRNYYVP